MVRNYVKKTNRASWDLKSMEMAIKADQNNEMSIRKASQSFGVPKDSLHRRVTNKLKTIPSDKPETKLFGTYRKVLNDGQEKELSEYILKMDDSFYGMTIRELQRVVFEYCEKN